MRADNLNVILHNMARNPDDWRLDEFHAQHKGGVKICTYSLFPRSNRAGRLFQSRGLCLRKTSGDKRMSPLHRLLDSQCLQPQTSDQDE